MEEGFAGWPGVGHRVPVEQDDDVGVVAAAEEDGRRVVKLKRCDVAKTFLTLY